MSKDESVNIEIDGTCTECEECEECEECACPEIPEVKENMTEGQPLTAQEIAQQVAQAVNQSNDAMMSKLSDMMSGKVSTHVTEERTYDIGEGEFWKSQMGNLFNNTKRTYDEYQRLSIDGADKNRNHFDKVVSDAQEADNRKRGIADQALQNAVETANMVSKQAVRHGDLAIDRQWNVDEQAGFVAKVLNSIQDPATSAAMAVAIAEAMLKK